MQLACHNSTHGKLDSDLQKAQIQYNIYPEFPDQVIGEELGVLPRIFLH